MFTALTQEKVTDVSFCARWGMLVIILHSLCVCGLGRTYAPGWTHLSDSCSCWSLMLSLSVLHSGGQMSASKPSAVGTVNWLQSLLALSHFVAQKKGNEMLSSTFPSPFPQVLYEDSHMVTLTAPYIAGFLAFRETPFLLDALQRLERNQPKLLPQVQFIKIKMSSLRTSGHNCIHKISSEQKILHMHSIKLLCQFGEQNPRVI